MELAQHIVSVSAVGLLDIEADGVGVERVPALRCGQRVDLQPGKDFVLHGMGQANPKTARPCATARTTDSLSLQGDKAVWPIQRHGGIVVGINHHCHCCDLVGMSQASARSIQKQMFLKAFSPGGLIDGKPGRATDCYCLGLRDTCP